MALLRSNFRTEFDAQNAGNGVSGVQNFFPRTPLDYMVVPPNFRVMLQSDF
jgi:hypothetical protein